MSSRTKLPGFLVAAALAAFALTVRASIKEGDLFPFPAPGAISGALPDIGGKVVMVDFWASWCGPCRASCPAYARLQADFAPRGLVIVAVSIDDTDAAYAAFLRKYSPAFATVRDRGQNLAALVGIPGMPATYLIDRRGRIRFVHEGFHSGRTEPVLRGQIEKLLAEK